jgi:hypothetical protein
MDIIYSKCYNGVIMVGGFADEFKFILVHLETPESLDMVYTWYILGIYF